MKDRLVSSIIVSEQDADQFRSLHPPLDLLTEAFRRQATEFIQKREEAKGDSGLFMIRLEWIPEGGVGVEANLPPSITRPYCIACGHFIGLDDVCEIGCPNDAMEDRPKGTVGMAIYELQKPKEGP